MTAKKMIQIDYETVDGQKGSMDLLRITDRPMSAIAREKALIHRFRKWPYVMQREIDKSNGIVR